ncbi:MAG: hypothetical protein P4L57_02540 [Rhizomicrobium sp.]|nr:hypothetical protein [Rhizomicrobium sp.]
MKKGLKLTVALKTSVAALALCIPISKASAVAVCARPQEESALQTAALQQRLMVAALSCHNVADYNRFVLSHRPELQESDRMLMAFFVRRNAQKGTDDYNAYKTELANVSSLQNIRDSGFCRSAKAAFDEAFRHQGSVAEMVSQQPSLIKTGYVSCTPSTRDSIQTADATPSIPLRHQAFADDQTASVLDPDMAARLDRVLPRANTGPVMPPQEDARYGRDDDSRYRADTEEDSGQRQYAPAVDEVPRYDPRYADRMPPPRPYNRDDDRYGRNDDRNGDGYGDGYGRRYANRDDDDDRGGYGGDPRAIRSRDADRFADDRPDADRSGYRPDSDQPYAYWPPARARYVRGDDGFWHLLLPNPR